MAVITVNGNQALSSFTAPDAYVNIVPPAPYATVGASSNIGALVGTASWGPLNQIISVSDSGSLVAACGQQTVAPYDAVTEAQMALALNNALYLVRVDNGTSAAASLILKDTNATPATGITINAKYTGIVGNTISVTVAAGSLSTTSNPTVTATIQRAGYQPEVFPNLPSPSTGSTFWTALASAINSGISGVRGPSSIVTATLPGTLSLYPPALVSSVPLTGGSNGDSFTSLSAASTAQVGTDGTVGRTGMYVLRGSGAAVFGLAGNSDSTQWATLQTFAESQGMLAVSVFPSGTSTTSAISTKQGVNANADWIKLLKDYLTIQDTVNNVQRSITPIGLYVGFRSGLSPWQSTLNKPVQGFTNFLATERTGSPYSEAEIGQLTQAGIDSIQNPIPRGNVYGMRTGAVASGNDDSYPLFTAFLANSFGQIMGQFVGDLQSTAKGDATRQAARSALRAFMQTQAGNISAYTLTLDSTNNTATTVGQGYLIGSIQVTYLGVVRNFILNFQGGATVQVAIQSA